MARSYEQIMKDIEAVRATPAFKKKEAAWQKEQAKQKKAAKVKEVETKVKPKPAKTSKASRPATTKPRRIAGGRGMGGAMLGGGGSRGPVIK